MENKFVFSSFLNWLKSTEMFARPSKQLPGKWQLFEYYIETNDKLSNIKEAQLTDKNENWVIEFTEENKFVHHSNLKVALITEIENGMWQISRNFITLIYPGNFKNNIEFQYAVENKILKLLRKDMFGRIEFFGFFRKTEIA